MASSLALRLAMPMGSHTGGGPHPVAPWLLKTGVWNNAGVWLDSATWTEWLINGGLWSDIGVWADTLTWDDGAQPFVGPLDIVGSPILAFGMRALSTAKLGTAVFTLRRDSDDATQSFSSDATTGAVDEAAVAAFLGGANGLGTSWIDQSPNSIDVGNPTPTLQPLWLPNLVGGRPGFTASDTFHGGAQTSAGTVSTSTGGATIFAVSSQDTDIFLTTNTGGYIELYMGRSGPHPPYIDMSDGPNEAGGEYPLQSGINLYDAAWEFGSANFQVNGAVQTQTTSYDNGGPLGAITGLIPTLYIDQQPTPAVVNDILCEMILYDGVLSDANRLAIRQNIAAYYGIAL